MALVLWSPWKRGESIRFI